MIPRHRNSTLMILGSYLFAVLLAIVPLPDWGQAFRPEWLALVLIFWTVSSADRVGVVGAWWLGLGMDVIYGSLLGQYALGYAFIAFIALKIHQRFRFYLLWQQSVFIFFLLLAFKTIIIVIRGMAGFDSSGAAAFWFPLVSSMLAWPLVYMVMVNITNKPR